MSSYFLRVHLMEAMFDWADTHRGGTLPMIEALTELAELQRALIADLTEPEKIEAIRLVRDAVLNVTAQSFTRN